MNLETTKKKMKILLTEELFLMIIFLSIMTLQKELKKIASYKRLTGNLFILDV